MQICHKCGKGIKYIPTGFDEIVICDPVVITIYTERGRRVEGYAPHKCSEVKDNGRNEENNQKDN